MQVIHVGAEINKKRQGLNM
jgi:mitogen-activated protein kinase 1/3